MAAALATLVRDAGLRERLGSAARAVALGAFSADAIVDRYLDLYERLTREAARTKPAATSCRRPPHWR